MPVHKKGKYWYMGNRKFKSKSAAESAYRAYKAKKGKTKKKKRRK